jgi:hypothetical protein
VQPDAASQAAKTPKVAAPPQSEVQHAANRVAHPVMAGAYQHPGWGRLSFALHGNPAPAVNRGPDGLELTFAAGTQLQISPRAHLREITSIDTAEENGTQIVRVRLACDCVPDEETVAGVLRLDFHDKSGSGKNAPASGTEAKELNTLRETLTARLATLNGVPPGHAAGATPGPSAAAVQGQATPEHPGPPPVCIAPVDASGWGGTGAFVPRLTALRAQMAATQGSAPAMAALAEFYLANGLGHEAFAVASDALDAGAVGEDHLRLARDADIARLLKGEQLSPGANLVAELPNCNRPDGKLWRSLAAAAAHDEENAARDPEAVASVLRTLPDPLLRALAFHIVAGVGNNADALRATAGALRNITDELPEDAARRYLLQARLAAISGDKADYAAFLESASHADMTVPGVIAKARLAAIRAAGDGPDAAYNEAILADAARTYRHEALGQQSAEQYAELQLKRHDYAAALQIADESAGPRGAQPTESNGASLAVRVLRMVLVDPTTPALPGPPERIALYLRYGGYTTPGEKGDDIRLAAARLMLAQGMPVPALEALRQVSDAAAVTQDVMRMRATAEAEGGDPAKAMELARSLPDGIEQHRIAAEAMSRMNKPVEAAHLLDNAPEASDRARRASLLFEGEAWKDAAAAYADLVSDPAVPAGQRNDMAKRYALAVAMSGAAPAVTPAKLPELPARLLAAVPPAPPAGTAQTPPAGAPRTAANPSTTSAPPDLDAVRGALDRARSIETLLGPTTAHQGS